ncbi:MAG TPA: A/G-specific adenine glycosylase [Patescibacteria group bacterium]|nr:A/G-specific adenine glycosylase [Patescibacteria group bacterium]
MSSPILFQKLLLFWFKKNKRDLPWREVPRDPYHILVSELMLQQTQVSRVLPKYKAFLSKWPTIESLSRAKLSEVLIAWQGLGYNRRAKYLLETAKILVGKTFPSETKELQRLPGFGPYMVSAIRVFAFNFQEVVMDVNVKRVYGRLDIDPFVPKGKADEWHQALMDFGALVCTARQPHCEACVLSKICSANSKAKVGGYQNFADFLIANPAKKKMSKKDVGKKFEETDRYFRGRIIDFLRQGESSMLLLQTHIVETHKLSDRKRFGTIIESLVIDGLICIRANKVYLA